ncbi:MAG: radical SAM protein [Elusimicrobiota bacterium]
MKKNVVLIQPAIGDMDMFRGRPTPPVGLMCAAALVDPGIEIRLVDQRVDRDWRARLAGALDEGTVATGLTAMTGAMILHALKAAEEVRRLSRAPIIWGGIHASLLPEQTVAHQLADYVVQGEGEAAFAELVRRLAGGADTGGIPGVWRKVNGRPEGTPRTDMLDLAELPPVPYHLVDMEKYMQFYGGGRRTLFYQSSRGCPHRCAYCYNRAFNAGRWRARPAEAVLRELAGLKERYRLDAVFIWDDNFFIDHPRAMRIIGGIKDLGMRCLLHGADVETLARMTDGELDFLAEAGVDALSLGVESASDRVRRDILRKRGTVADVKAQLARFRGRPTEVFCYMILGFPGETREEMKETIKLALEILDMGPNFHLERFFNFTPYPGTELYDGLDRAGTSFPSRLEDWGSYHWDYSRLAESDPATADFLERVDTAGNFIDRIKDPFVRFNWLLGSLISLYRPVARARLRYGLLRPMPEVWLSRAFKKLVKPLK